MHPSCPVWSIPQDPFGSTFYITVTWSSPSRRSTMNSAHFWTTLEVVTLKARRVQRMEPVWPWASFPNFQSPETLFFWTFLIAVQSCGSTAFGLPTCKLLWTNIQKKFLCKGVFEIIVSEIAGWQKNCWSVVRGGRHPFDRGVRRRVEEMSSAVSFPLESDPFRMVIAPSG